MTVLFRNAHFFFDGTRMRENVDVVVDSCGARVDKDKTDAVFDARNFLIMPSFFNAHAHIPMVLFRGVYGERSFHEWLSGIWSLERRWRRRYAYPASLVSLAENLAFGTTDVCSMYFFLSEVARAAEKLGMNVYIGPVFMDSIVPPSVVRVYAHIFLRRYRKSTHVRPAVFLHSLYTCSPETASIAATLSEKYDVPLQIHVSETREEVIEMKKRYGKYPVYLLDDAGAVTERAVLVHCGWITKNELDIIARRRASVVHCPSSNMKLATHGFFPWRELKERGINIFLGTDSQASNNTQDMFLEMRTAALLGKHAYWDSAAVTSMDVLKAAARGSGWIAVDISGLRFVPLNRTNVLENIVFNGHGDLVRYAVIGGDLLYPFSEDVKRELSDAFLTLQNAFTQLRLDSFDGSENRR